MTIPRAASALASRRTVVRFAGPDDDPGHAADPTWLTEWLGEAEVQVLAHLDSLVYALRRARPALVLLDGTDPERAAGACARVKLDPYTGLVPCVVIETSGAHAVSALLNAGADEVIPCTAGADEARARLDAALRRSVRDLAAQPTTGLPGTPAIDAFIARLLEAGTPFAAVYADLDHFKEYNDRYGFHEGDRVIRMVARLLHDVGLGIAGADAFVGHIGGDDFLCVLPLALAQDACTLMIDTFDLLVPQQYNAADRRAGYYLGKDRRGQLHRVPLMTLSLGVATTERRRYDSAAEVSRLASEMKSFAKTLPGSVFAFDRRSDDVSPPPAPIAEFE